MGDYVALLLLLLFVQSKISYFSMHEHLVRYQDNLLGTSHLNLKIEIVSRHLVFCITVSRYLIGSWNQYKEICYTISTLATSLLLNSRSFSIYHNNYFIIIKYNSYLIVMAGAQSTLSKAQHIEVP